MEDGWVRVYTTGNAVTAEIIRGMLEENSISCVELNHKDSSYLFGEAEIYVPSEFEAKALELINTCDFE